MIKINEFCQTRWPAVNSKPAGTIGHAFQTRAFDKPAHCKSRLLFFLKIAFYYNKRWNQENSIVLKYFKILKLNFIGMIIILKTIFTLGLALFKIYLINKVKYKFHTKMKVQQKYKQHNKLLIT